MGCGVLTGNRKLGYGGMLRPAAVRSSLGYGGMPRPAWSRVVTQRQFQLLARLTVRVRPATHAAPRDRFSAFLVPNPFKSRAARTNPEDDRCNAPDKEKARSVNADQSQPESSSSRRRRGGEPGGRVGRVVGRTLRIISIK